jgi:hypothetical protein
MIGIAEQTTGRTLYLWCSNPVAFQFDWSEDWATDGGERINRKLHTKRRTMGIPGAGFIRCTHEMLFDAHWHACVFGSPLGAYL